MNDTVIVLFTYNRVESTKKVIESLKNNNTSFQYDLVIFSDSAKGSADLEKVSNVRNYISNISGFKSVKCIYRDCNYGLAKSVISGISSVLKDYEKVIVLEDDLLLSANFLEFMQQGLDLYQTKTEVLNISGFSYKNRFDTKYDNFFWGRATSWGWATWKDRWDNVDWDLPFNSERELIDNLNNFDKFGEDLPRMLIKQYRNEINSWAIRWCYHQYRNDLLSVVPIKSKVMNLGFGVDATHCVDERRLKVDFDNSEKQNFRFDTLMVIKPDYFKHYIKNYSRWNKILDKLIGKLSK